MSTLREGSIPTNIVATTCLISDIDKRGEGGEGREIVANSSFWSLSLDDLVDAYTFCSRSIRQL